MERLGAVILAAGLSSRMGEFKPLLPIGGVSMIRRVVDLMRGAGAETVVVTGYRHEALEAHLVGCGIRFVHNPDYRHTQMLDSLRLGLGALPAGCGRFLLSPADVPLVRPRTVRALLALDAPFVRPLYRGEPGHPVVFRAGLLPLIRCYSGSGGLGGLVDTCGVPVRELEVDDLGVCMDGDTREQYNALLRAYQAIQDGRCGA